MCICRAWGDEFVKYIRLLFAGILFLLLFFSLFYLSKPSGTILDKNWEVYFDDQPHQLDMPYYDFVKQSGRGFYKITFGATEGDTLVIPKISCYAFKVYLNNQLIRQVGDFKNPTANVWNYAHVIRFNTNILNNDHNELLIQAYFLDDVGMHIPPFIERYENIITRISFYNIF